MSVDSSALALFVQLFLSRAPHCVEVGLDISACRHHHHHPSHPVTLPILPLFFTSSVTGINTERRRYITQTLVTCRGLHDERETEKEIFTPRDLTSLYPRVVCQIKFQHPLPLPLSLRKDREHPALRFEDLLHHREYEATTIDYQDGSLSTSLIYICNYSRVAPMLPKGEDNV